MTVSAPGLYQSADPRPPGGAAPRRGGGGGTGRGPAAPPLRPARGPGEAAHRGCHGGGPGAVRLPLGRHAGGPGVSGGRNLSRPSGGVSPRWGDPRAARRGPGHGSGGTKVPPLRPATGPRQDPRKTGNGPPHDDEGDGRCEGDSRAASSSASPGPPARPARGARRGRRGGAYRDLTFLANCSMGMAGSVMMERVPRDPSSTEMRAMVSLSGASTTFTKSYIPRTAYWLRPFPPMPPISLFTSLIRLGVGFPVFRPWSVGGG